MYIVNFAMFCCGLTLYDFTHILQEYLIDTEAIQSYNCPTAKEAGYEQMYFMES